MENVSLKAAIAYSQRLNWAVFPLHSIAEGRCTCGKPCSSPGKHPRTANGFKGASMDIDVITKWFTMWPASNIGIATGEASGFWVLDVDRHGANGFDSLEQLTDKYGKLPDTVEAITGGNGSHLLFKYREGIGNRTDLLPGIDTRGQGGFIVVAPSNHLSGNAYQWELSSHPLDTEVAEAPQWLLNMLVKPKTATPIKKPSSYWSNIMAGVAEGGRNSAAASLTGTLLSRYVDPVLVKEIVNLWNAERNDPPLDQVELDIILNSIFGLEVERRRKGAKYG